MYKELQQFCIEDKYDKANIINHIVDDIGTTMLVKQDKLTQAINKYMCSSYYESKHIRINHLRQFEITNLVSEIFSILIPLEGSHPIQSISGQLAAYLKYEDIFDGIKTAAELITLACYVDICNIVSSEMSDTGSLLVKSNYRLENKTITYINNTKYLPPMLCEPMRVNKNNQSGYLSKNDFVILGKGNNHFEPLALDVLNIMNKVELCLDERILTETELPTSELDTNEKVINHDRMVASSKVVYEELLEQGNSFYFTHKFDSRGRLYSQGYHVNYQGSPYKRASISLKQKELIV